MQRKKGWKMGLERNQETRSLKEKMADFWTNFESRADSIWMSHRPLRRNMQEADITPLTLKIAFLPCWPLSVYGITIYPAAPGIILHFSSLLLVVTSTTSNSSASPMNSAYKIYPKSTHLPPSSLPPLSFSKDKFDLGVILALLPWEPDSGGMSAWLLIIW